MNKKNKTIIHIFALVAILFSMLIFSMRLKAATSDTDYISVVAISNSTKPVYAIYWPKDKGTITLYRSDNAKDFQQIVQTDADHYLDYDIDKNLTYTYKIILSGKEYVSNGSDIPGGQSVISGVKIEAGAVSKTEASVIVSFMTDKLAKSQVFYGQGTDYGKATDLDQSLNQSHTVLIEKLMPETTYHFKIRTQDKDDKGIVETADQVFTTPAPPTQQTILEIIVQALAQAFSGFEKWLSS